MQFDPSWRNRLAPLPNIVWLAACLLCITCATLTSAEDWPQWRGPNRDGAWNETGLLESFPAAGIDVRWRKPIGPGWSSPVIAQGRVFVVDLHVQPRPVQERVHCFDEASGKLLWTYAYDAAYPDWALVPGQETLPTPTPCVQAGKLYVLGATGHVHCLNAATGALLWEKRLDQEFEIKELSCRSSPLIESGLVIFLIGGKPGGGVIALEKDSGKLVWKALDESASNSSPIVITGGGKRQLIVWTDESVSSLVPTSGEVNWRERLLTSNNDSIATPVCEKNWLLVSGVMFDLNAEQARASIAWPKSRALSRRILSNTSTPLIQGDHIYSARTGGELVCLDIRTGEQVWATDTVTGLKSGASIHLTLNDDVVWLFTDEGNLVRARLTPAGYHEISRAHVLEPTSTFSGHKFAWVPPAYANRHLFARNDKELVCASLAAPAKEP
jgi:outer membrane protein assembly factor BamB